MSASTRADTFFARMPHGSYGRSALARALLQSAPSQRYFVTPVSITLNSAMFDESSSV